MGMSPTLLRPRQNLHPDAASWASRVVANGGSVGSSLPAVNTFCKAIAAAGIRDRFYRLNLFCGNSDATLAAVRTPLYRGPSLSGTQFGNATDTNANFVAGDYVETGSSGGLTGNGSTKYLNTGFQPFASGSAIAQYGHGSLWAMTLPASRLNVLGCRRESAQAAYAGGQLDHTGKAWMAWDAVAVVAGQGAASAPFFGIVSRRSDDRVYWSVNATAVANSASTAAGTTTVNYGLFCHIFDNGSVALAALRIAGYSIGAELSASQEASLYSAWLAFQQSLGRIA